MSEPKEFPQDMRIDLFDSTQILIPFTREEWMDIYLCYRESGYDPNVQDRLEKNLGVK